MLIAERARSERLVQIIKEMQRHRFGRRAETLPEDQMLPALEEAEQTEAGATAEDEAGSTQVRAAVGATAAHCPPICRATAIPTARPTISCRGPMRRRNRSSTWPGNAAYGHTA